MKEIIMKKRMGKEENRHPIIPMKKHFTKLSTIITVIIVAIIFYSYAFFDYMEYVYMGFLVDDAGLIPQHVYTVFHNLTPRTIATILAYQPILFLFPFLQLGVVAEMIAQLVIVALIIIVTAIYLKASNRLDSLITNILIIVMAFSFLIYGMVYFTFHFQTMFPFFFILGMYFYRKKREKLATLSFLMSSFLRFPLGLLTTYLLLLYSIKYRDKKLLKPLIFVVPFSLVYPSIIMEMGLIANVTYQAHITTGYTVPMIAVVISDIIFVFLMSLIGDIFDILALLPFLVVTLAGHYLPYTLPYFSRFQYGSELLAQYVIALGDSIRIPQVTKPKKDIEFHKLVKGVRLSMFIMSMIFFSVLYSPFYLPHIYKNNNVNVAYQILKFVPNNATLITTNNIPEAYPRGGFSLSTGFVLIPTAYYLGGDEWTATIYGNVNKTTEAPYFLIDLYGVNSLNVYEIQRAWFGGYKPYVVDYNFILLKYGYNGSPIIINNFEIYPDQIFTYVSPIYLMPLQLGQPVLYLPPGVYDIGGKIVTYENFTLTYINTSIILLKLLD